MAWTAPRTWTGGEVPTASMMNTHIRDNHNYLYGNRVPAGVIIFWNGTSCPDGWTEYTALRGYSPKGLPASGTLNGVAPASHPGIAAGSGYFPGLVVAHTHGVGSLASSFDGSHTHGVGSNWDGGGSGVWPQTGDDPGATYSVASGGDGGHSHTMLSGATGSPSAVGGTDVTMPYIQYLACQKGAS